MPRMIYKAFVSGVALLVFGAISAAPFLYWEAESKRSRSHNGHGTLIDWIMGPTMIVWFPIVVLLAAGIAFLIVFIFWPRKKLTIGEIARRKEVK